MAVDSAVADHIRRVRVIGDRLLPARYIHDRQTLVAQPRVLQLDPAGLVRPSVVDSSEHPLALLRGRCTYGSDDSAHEAGHILDRQF